MAIHGWASGIQSAIASADATVFRMGAANAVMVRQSLRFNLSAAEPCLAEVARAVGASVAADDAAAAQALVDRVDQLAAILGTPISLARHWIAGLVS